MSNEILYGESAETENIIKQYIDSMPAGQGGWEPNWQRWVIGTSIDEKYRELGSLKKKVYDMYHGQNKKEISTIVDNLALGKYFPSEKDAYKFVENTLKEDKDDIKKWMYAGDPSKGGIKLSKNQFHTDVKNIMAFMYPYKDKFSPVVKKSFFNLVRPHGTIPAGGKEGWAKNIEDMNHTQLY